MNPYPTLRFRAPDGKLRSFDNLWPDDLKGTLEYIAIALAGVHRFNGFGGPYTVAQHCCLCDDLYSGGDLGARRAILLHDAAEALTGDLPSPWKTLLPDFQELERNIQNSLAKHLEKHRPLCQVGEFGSLEVERVDSTAMKMEARRLFGDTWKEQFGFPADTTIYVELQAAERVLQNHKGVWSKIQAADEYLKRLTRAFRIDK